MAATDASHSSRASSASLPKQPEPMDAAGRGAEVLSRDDIESLKKEIADDRKAFENQLELSRKVSALCTEATNAIQYGMPEAAEKASSQARQELHNHEAASPHTKGDRAWTLQGAYEEYVKVAGLQHFLQTGKVLPRPHDLLKLLKVEDEEYISGIISVCQELTHYALRRATVLDANSVELCRNFIADIKSELIGFDFRNGPLRRRFDGIKYAERRCEDLLYDLSFTQTARKEMIEQLADEVSKEPRRSILDDQDRLQWKEMQQVYADYDKKREEVIKACRDVQKSAKQAIYAAHRGDLPQANNLIKIANEGDTVSKTLGVMQIWENYIKDSPGLRSGSFACALEELAEAELFLRWLEKQGSISESHFILPQRSDLASGKLKAYDYLGALSDFTGEVGRVAVEAATKRNHQKVRCCLQSVFAAHAVLAAVALPGKQDKKLEAAERNFRKLETIEYDLKVRDGKEQPGDRFDDEQAMLEAQGRL